MQTKGPPRPRELGSVTTRAEVYPRGSWGLSLGIWHRSCVSGELSSVTSKALGGQRAWGAEIPEEEWGQVATRLWEDT